MLLFVFVVVMLKWSCLEESKVNLILCKDNCCIFCGVICDWVFFIMNFILIVIEWNFVCGEVYKNELV